MTWSLIADIPQCQTLGTLTVSSHKMGNYGFLWVIVIFKQIYYIVHPISFHPFRHPSISLPSVPTQHIHPLRGVRVLLLTWSVPTEVHGFGGRPGGDPQGEQAHHHAAKVCQEVGRIGHDGQAVGEVAPCGKNPSTAGWLVRIGSLL